MSSLSGKVPMFNRNAPTAYCNTNPSPELFTELIELSVKSMSMC